LKTRQWAVLWGIATYTLAPLVLGISTSYVSRQMLWPPGRAGPSRDLARIAKQNAPSAARTTAMETTSFCSLITFHSTNCKNNVSDFASFSGK
jgi:hypothetical protein